MATVMTEPEVETGEDTIEPVIKLTKDLKEAARLLTPTEARYLTDTYYQIQDQRIRAAGQVRAMSEEAEPHAVLLWYFGQSATLENEIKKALDKYSMASPVGEWARSVHGVGPVIAAGLLAHIDIRKAPTVGHIWSFAGLEPKVEWKKGEIRPWNARLKVLCWKLGESFVKVSGNEKAFYGKIYRERKALEIERNERGEFAEQAKAKLEKFKIGKTTDAYAAYSAGKLPPAHIHARACRYAVKMFLAHLHEVWYRHEFKTDPPLPYPIAHLGHAHKIEVPE